MAFHISGDIRGTPTPFYLLSQVPLPLWRVQHIQQFSAVQPAAKGQSEEYPDEAADDRAVQVVPVRPAEEGEGPDEEEQAADQLQVGHGRHRVYGLQRGAAVWYF